jgi:hypothetical protein
LRFSNLFTKNHNSGELTGESSQHRKRLTDFRITRCLTTCSLVEHLDSGWLQTYIYQLNLVSHVSTIFSNLFQKKSKNVLLEVQQLFHFMTMLSKRLSETLFCMNSLRSSMR